jgi:hypothetical protein
LTFPVGFENSVINIRCFCFKPREQGRTEVKTDPRVIVDELDDLVVPIENPRHGIRRIAFRRNALVPVVIRVSGILKFDVFEPGVLERPLVEMTVDPNESSPKNRITEPFSWNFDGAS